MANSTIYPYGTGGSLPTGYPIINDLTTGGADKALSAEMGKELNDKMYRKPETVSTDYNLSALNATVVKGARNPGKGLGDVDTEQSQRATLTVTDTGCFLAANLPDTFTVHVPSGFLVAINQAAVSTATSTEYLASPWMTDGDSITLDKANYPYVSFNFKAEDNSAMIYHLQELAVFYITGTNVESGTINIVNGAGQVVKSMYNTQDSSVTNIYTKDAVDALIGDASSGSAQKCYRTAVEGESASYENQTFARSDFAINKQRQPGAGITGSSQLNRLCIDKIYDLQGSTDNLDGIVSMHIPSGYTGGVTQCKVTTSTTDENNYLMHTWGAGDVAIELDPNYRYVTFNFKRDDNGRTYDTDAAAFVSDFYMVKATEPTITTTKSLEIVGADGSVVKTIYNDDDGDTVQVASKAYVDALIPSPIEPSVLRVLALNIGHFANGASQNPSINNSNYDEKLKQWKSALNKSCANILLLSEFDPTFGSHTVSGSSVSESSVDAVFKPLYPYSSVGTKNGYACNAVISKSALGGGSSVNYTSRGQLMYYRMDTIVVGGKTVKLVATHLDWSQNETYAGYRAAQIQQLITAFKNEPYVIIAGDFNIDATSEWDTFVNNGFSIVNHGDLGDIFTYPATGANELATAIADRPFPDKALDNIIVKGFRIGNVRLVDEGTLTDHCGIMADLTLIE